MSNSDQNLSVSSPQNALILFCDIIDSCKYSAVLEIEKYAMEILKLQNIFKELGDIYFPKKKNHVTAYVNVTSRGDEGIIFCVDPDIEPEDLIYKAVQFSFELKANFELAFNTKSSENKVPKPIDVGIGIHYGKVAPIIKLEKSESSRPRSIIDRIEGFSINYGKRVESCSRIGRYSKVFLSKEAAALLDGDPIVLIKHIAPMIGIEINEEVFEIRSAFFKEMPLQNKEKDNESFITLFTTKINEFDFIRKPWLKSLVISVLDSRIRAITDPQLKSKYSSILSEIAWQKYAEDDPIILFWRAKEYEYDKKYTQSLSYLKQIIENYPHFIHARKKLVNICWELSKTDAEQSEKVFVRDIASEFLERFSEYLGGARARLNLYP